jgi:hypothetical protein
MRGGFSPVTRAIKALAELLPGTSVFETPAYVDNSTPPWGVARLWQVLQRASRRG